MITATARKHVVRALREALAIREPAARSVLETIRNENALRLLGARDMRSVRALVVTTGTPRAALYVNDGQGYEATGVELRLSDEDMARWNALPLEQAYAVAGDIMDNPGPAMVAADARLAAENDNLLPEEEMDRVFGPVPESREWSWTEGTLLRADLASAGDHVVVLVDLADGTRATMAMFPLFSDAADLLAYASGRIGTPARLCTGRVNAFDNDVPAGFDRSMRVLDMIIPQSEVPGLVRSMARAA